MTRLLGALALATVLALAGQSALTAGEKSEDTPAPAEVDEKPPAEKPEAEQKGESGKEHSEEEAKPTAKPGPLDEEELEALLRTLDALQQKTRGFYAEFENVTESALVFEEIKSRGETAFLKPETYYRRVGGEEPVTVFLNSEYALTYYENENRAERIHIKKGKGKKDVEALLSGLSFNLGNLKKRFKMAAEREKSGNVRMDLEPLKEDDPLLKYMIRISIWTDGKCPWPLAVETENPDGDLKKDTFRKMVVLEKDKEIPEKVKKALEFEPPRGTRVTDIRPR